MTPFRWTRERLPAVAGGLSACHFGGAPSEVARPVLAGSGLLHPIPPGVRKITTDDQASRTKH